MLQEIDRMTDVSENRSASGGSPSEATEIGFIQGEALHKTGSKPEHVEFNMDMEIGDYATSPFAEQWRAGFRAGYLGHPRPR
jgi:hypothetical protein